MSLTSFRTFSRAIMTTRPRRRTTEARRSRRIGANLSAREMLFEKHLALYRKTGQATAYCLETSRRQWAAGRRKAAGKSARRAWGYTPASGRAFTIWLSYARPRGRGSSRRESRFLTGDHVSDLRHARHLAFSRRILQRLQKTRGCISRDRPGDGRARPVGRRIRRESVESGVDLALTAYQPTSLQGPGIEHLAFVGERLEDHAGQSVMFGYTQQRSDLRPERLQAVDPADTVHVRQVGKRVFLIADDDELQVRMISAARRTCSCP